jgi:glycogen(starch) synthase
VRILTAGNMYPPHHLGGYELVWHATVDHLRARGHVVRVLTTDFRLDRPDGSIAEGDDVHRALRWYWREHEFPRTGPRARLAIERHNARVLERHLAELRPDAVCWWSMGGMSLSLVERVRRRGLPALAVVHDDWPVYAPKVDAWTRALGGRRRVARAAERALGVTTCHALAGAARWSFNSRFNRDRVTRVLGDDGSVDTPGVDTRLFREVAPGEWAWRLLYCGRIDARKGLDVAVRALAELPDATLRVAGGGDARHLRELEALAAELGVSDRLAFETPARAELPGVYADADVVVFPVRWEEPWGLVPLEAMAVGRPVVASGRGGSREYLDDGRNCLLADPDEGPAPLADAVRRLAADPGLRERIRARGIDTAARHTQDAFGRAIEERLGELVSA